MKTIKNKTKTTSLTSNELDENKIWDKEKMNSLREFILLESKKQSPERRLRNELLSIKYQIEDYIQNDVIEKEMKIVDFVRLYLRLLKISQKQLASAFEMRDTNLYKYLIGERKLNPDLVLKLSSFSHTPPELWYYVQTKNELYELKKEKEKIKEYEKKYTYEKLIANF